MNLISLIGILKDKQQTIDFAASEVSFISEYYDINVYLKGSLSIESDIKFVDAMSEPMRVFTDTDTGANYFELFILDELRTIVGQLLSDRPDADDFSIAKRIIEYRINDA